jgi:hypothetical protein
MRDERGLRLALPRYASITVLAICAVASAAFMGFCEGSAPEGPPLPPATPFPADLADRLHTIRDGTALHRDLPVNDDVVEGTITRDQLRAYYDEFEALLDDEDGVDIDVYNKAMRLLHMLGPEDDIFEEIVEGESEDIAGFFVPDENRLVLIREADESDISHFDEIILAHEYVHSFQHEAFDRGTFESIIENEDEDQEAATEYAETLECVKEGDATLAAFIYAFETYGRDWLDALDGDDVEGSSDAEAADVETALDRYEAFPYDECASWAADLYVDAGRTWSSINEAYRRPPWTTEQILHPEKYRDREGVTGMRAQDLQPRLGDTWERVELDIFGEFDVYNYLYTITGDEDAARSAAAGWGVGWIGIYTDPAAGSDRDVLVHIALEFDTLMDLAQFGMAYGAVLNAVGGDSLRSGDGGRPTCWQADGEFGYIGWADGLRRVDMVISTSVEARDSVVRDALSAGNNGSCPVDSPERANSVPPSTAAPLQPR